MSLVLVVLTALLQAAAAPGTPAVVPVDARWVIPFETPPAAAPGFDAATAYVPLKGGQLVAVDIDSGSVRWRQDVNTPFTPATGDGLVFTVTDRTIDARDGLSGEVKWQATLPAAAAAPLYWDTGWLLASTTEGDLVALRAGDGTVVWRQAIGTALATAPAPALDRLFLPLADNRLMAVLLVSGETVWTRDLTGRITGIAALDDQLVFGTSDKRVTSVSLKNGREIWTWDVGGDVSGPPAADDELIYFAARDNVLRAVDRSSGNLRWKALLASRPAGGPLRLPDFILMPMVSSEMTAYDPKSGKQVAGVKVAAEIESQPFFRPALRLTAVRLVTVSRDGQLQGFGRRFEPLPAPLDVLPGAPAVP